MVRNYKRVTTQGQTAPDMMEKAVLEVVDFGYSIRGVASKYKIHFSTLSRYVKRWTSEFEKGDSHNQRVGYSKPVRTMAFKYAIEMGVRVPKNWINRKCAGKDWLINFMERNSGQLSKSQPEPTSLAGNSYFNEQEIWNLDVTRITTIQKPIGIDLGEEIPSGNEGQLVYNLCCHGPEGSIGASNPSGSVTDENFEGFINHFIQFTKVTTDKPMLLLLDKNQSFVNSNIISLCERSGIIIFSFPRHCSHKLQPLEKSVYGPLKNFIRSAQRDWLRNNPGKMMTIYDIPSIIKETFPKAMTPPNIRAGFKTAGIFPLNLEIFNKSDLAPSSITEIPHDSEDFFIEGLGSIDPTGVGDNSVRSSKENILNKRNSPSEGGNPTNPQEAFSSNPSISTNSSFSVYFPLNPEELIPDPRTDLCISEGGSMKSYSDVNVDLWFPAEEVVNVCGVLRGRRMTSLEAERGCLDLKGQHVPDGHPFSPGPDVGDTCCQFYCLDPDSSLPSSPSGELGLRLVASDREKRGEEDVHSSDDEDIAVTGRYLPYWWWKQDRLPPPSYDDAVYLGPSSSLFSAPTPEYVFFSTTESRNGSHLRHNDILEAVQGLR
ncbi:unnamed protein product [Lepeophtheirus salmonis]|uniref:(salmon louse) hypothetical protein n=1 Tax=Lepeophtheirus salmonis TaxID=72036 RepID=A0A7R8CDP6_LEPSM|nr:unnamed protein product [Lepeophtheirus salmonis]CAF2778658.1 unnamed protein product [Lepeophtheirus salmonis]